MNLQDIFKQFYSKAKTVDVKPSEGVFNSAKSSLTGFSARLEKRREAARLKKEEDAAKAKSGEEVKAESKEEMKAEAKDDMKTEQ